MGKIFNVTSIGRVRLNDGVILAIVIIVIYAAVIIGIEYESVLGVNTQNAVYGNQGFDLWWGSHVLLFAILGFLYPRQPLRHIVLGGTWELLEQISSYVPYFSNENRYNGKPVIYAKKWDMLGNFIGYLLGWGIAELVDKTEVGKKYIKREPAKYFAF